MTTKDKWTIFKYKLVPQIMVKSGENIPFNPCIITGSIDKLLSAGRGYAVRVQTVPDRRGCAVRAQTVPDRCGYAVRVQTVPAAGFHRKGIMALYHVQRRRICQIHMQ